MAAVGTLFGPAASIWLVHQVANKIASAGTIYVLESFLVPLSSPSDAQNSFTVFVWHSLFLLLEAVRVHHRRLVC